MPRSTIDIPHDEVEHLQILDEDGNVDKDLEPDLPAEELREWYRIMLLSRAWDDRRLKLQRQGRIGTFAPARGQEAAQVGSVAAVEETDWVVPSFRESAVAMYRGADLAYDLVYAAGYEEGTQIPEEDPRDLPINIPIATQIPQAAGVAWASKLKGEDDVTIAYFGDGATSEGDFHEGVNFAGVFDVPAVFFCQNNHWAISVPRERQTRAKTLAQKAIGYGIPAIQVDGNDVLAVHEATREAVDRARRGDGPTLIEAITYRMDVHTTADDPTVYRDDEEVEQWREKDPIDRFRTYLLDKGWLSEEEDEAWREEITEEIADAVDRFEEIADDITDADAMFDHIYKEMPENLKRQREELNERGPYTLGREH